MVAVDALVIVGYGLIVTVAVELTFGQPFDAAMELVTVYVPGALAARLISPVLVLTKTNPAGEAVKAPG